MKFGGVTRRVSLVASALGMAVYLHVHSSASKVVPITRQAFVQALFLLLSAARK